ncbi:MAG: hypothetical protein M1834_007805 [Cirrosporium novae-zelandiae]|nr:MAG: hypothetical protein M1834_007805 [Cirrosporium novae-zelandiae]
MRATIVNTVLRSTPLSSHLVQSGASSSPSRIATTIIQQHQCSNLQASPLSRSFSSRPFGLRVEQPSPAVPTSKPSRPTTALGVGSMIDGLFNHKPLSPSLPGDYKRPQNTNLYYMNTTKPRPIMDRFNQINEAQDEALSLRLGPNLGRSIDVDPRRGTDVGAALRRMSSLVTRNRVPHDFRAQKFHERQGMRRKRLRRTRWKRQFKQSFVAVVQQVEAMRRMGW